MITLQTQIDALTRIAKKHNIESALQKLKMFEDESNDFRIKVLFVGAFSAGKTALLNELLQTDYLAEALSPETSIATELMYSSTSAVELHGKGEPICIPLTDASVLRNLPSLTDYKKIVIRMNNDFLYTHNNLILVDMPGFDSPNCAHDKAIAAYAANSGNAYVLCVSCEEGTLTKPVIEGLREIRNYTKNLACVVTQSDKRTPEAVESIRDNIKTAISVIFNKSVIPCVVSINDDSVSAQLPSILENFDQSRIFREAFAPKLLGICSTLKNALTTLKKSAELNNYEDDITIREQLKKKANENHLFQAEKAKLSSRLNNSAKPAILADIENALKSNVSALASAQRYSNDYFASFVNGIIRPALITAVKRYTQAEIESFMVEDIEFTVWETPESNINIAEVQTKVKTAYRIVAATIGITTSIVAPWAELIIFFLPDIVHIFTKLTGETPENKIIREVIPLMIAQITPKIDEALRGIERDVIEQLTENFKDNLEAIDEAIHNANAHKELNAREHERLITEIDGDIVQLQRTEEEICNG